MVHLTDDGIFDAPMEKIWKYLSDQNGHNHTGLRFTKVVEQSDKGMTAETELKNPDGSWNLEVHHESSKEPSYRNPSRTNERHQVHYQLYTDGK